MVSAHRSGAELDESAENRLPTLRRAAEGSYDFVEMDVQRCKDGTYILRHDDHITIEGENSPIGSLNFSELQSLEHDIVTLREALEVLEGKSKAHVDLKFTSPDELYEDPASTYEVEAAKIAVEIMGVDQCIITTLEDQSVLAVRRWSQEHHPSLLVGLSLGRSSDGLGRIATARLRLSEIFAARRLKACQANLIVAHKQLAKLTLARLAQKLDVPLLVWTVDDDDELRAWLSDNRAWLVTSNFPRRAVDIRDTLHSDIR